MGVKTCQDFNPLWENLHIVQSKVKKVQYSLDQSKLITHNCLLERSDIHRNNYLVLKLHQYGYEVTSNTFRPKNLKYLIYAAKRMDR